MANQLTGGVRQGDLLSPLLFNLIMDKILAYLTTQLGYKMGENSIQAVCYAGDVVLVSDSEQNLQTLLSQFDQIAERLNMEISIEKTKCILIAKEQLKCEIKLKNTTLDQVDKFKYLGAEISARRDLSQEVKTQVTKGVRIAGYSLVWKNKYMSAKSKA